jgi:TetR/AcrR family transcriptional repressor of nem operon
MRLCKFSGLKDFSATSIQDLVETGLSRSSLYSSFKNKEQLYQQALSRYQRLISKSNIDLLSSDGSVKSIIQQLLSRIIEDELNDPQHRGCLMANACLELAGHDQRLQNLSRTTLNDCSSHWNSS